MNIYKDKYYSSSYFAMKPKPIFMFTTVVIFDNNIKNAKEIDFFILPKIGETISYGNKKRKYYRVDHIVHAVNAATNNGEQLLNIYVSESIIPLT